MQRERERWGKKEIGSEGTRHFGIATKIANYLPGRESNNLLGWAKVGRGTCYIYIYNVCMCVRMCVCEAFLAGSVGMRHNINLATKVKRANAQKSAHTKNPFHIFQHSPPPHSPLSFPEFLACLMQFCFSLAKSQMNFIDKLIASDVAIKISFAAARKICCATTRNLEMDDIPYTIYKSCISVRVRAREIVL